MVNVYAPHASVVWQPTEVDHEIWLTAGFIYTPLFAWKSATLVRNPLLTGAVPGCTMYRYMNSDAKVLPVEDSDVHFPADPPKADRKERSASVAWNVGARHSRVFGALLGSPYSNHLGAAGSALS